MSQGIRVTAVNSVVADAQRASRRGSVLRQGGVWADQNRSAALAMAVGLSARIVYWAVTDHKFEDALITVAHARSVIDGTGLTHHAGEPVTQGFTSAISVLVPLAGELTGTFIPKMDGFLMLRLASLVAFAVTIVAASSLCGRLGVTSWARAFVVMFLAIDYNQVFYGMAGMETQMVVAILLWAILATVDRAATRCGVLSALCLLARPELALFVAPALISLFAWDRRGAVRAGLITFAGVAPWLIFTTAYYGSPVPNTIKAKALAYHVVYPGSLGLHGLNHFLFGHFKTWWHTFTPFLEDDFVSRAPLPHLLSVVIAATIIALGILGALSTRHAPGWRAALAFMAIFVVYRMIYLPSTYFGWYYPPFTALLVLCAGAGVARVATLTPPASTGLAFVLIALFAWPFPAMAALDRDVQGLEDKVRLPMALWIRHHVPPGSVVTSESAGYVGFYGRPLLYDYPGLTSKRAVAIFETLGWRHDDLADLVSVARPAFAVFRPPELSAFVQRFPRAAANYISAAHFGVPPSQSSWTFGGVTEDLAKDGEFYVLRRISTLSPRRTRPASSRRRASRGAAALPASRAADAPETAG